MIWVMLWLVGCGSERAVSDDASDGSWEAEAPAARDEGSITLGDHTYAALTTTCELSPSSAHGPPMGWNTVHGKRSRNTVLREGVVRPRVADVAGSATQQLRAAAAVSSTGME